MKEKDREREEEGDRKKLQKLHEGKCEKKERGRERMIKRDKKLEGERKRKIERERQTERRREIEKSC